MDNEAIVQHMLEIFGDKVVDPDVFPKQARYQFAVAKYELEINSRKTTDTTPATT